MAALDQHYTGSVVGRLIKANEDQQAGSCRTTEPPRHTNDGRTRPTDSFPLSCVQKDAYGVILALDRGYVRVVDV